MSLLTNEQVNEIIDIHNTTHTQFAHRLRVWNEKQTGVQDTIDWQNAPKFADKAVLRLYWVTGGKGSELWTASEDAITFERPKPVITPHPHAEMIAKYAEVAQRRIDPWVEFEWFDEYDGKWKKNDWDIKFNSLNKFRHIGETK